MTLPGVLRNLGVAALAVAWALAAYLGSAGTGPRDLIAAVAVAPFAVALAIALWRVRSRALVIGLVLLACGLLVWAWPRLRENVVLLFYLEHLGSHLALGGLFGRTLFGPGEALVTRLARHIFGGQLSARNARYTRQVTVAWTLFFLGNALVSTLLFWLAPLSVWSVHANLLTGPLIALMFAAEHLCRLWVLPPEERPSLATAIRAYRQRQALVDTTPSAP